jgi:hypothetical protein
VAHHFLTPAATAAAARKSAAQETGLRAVVAGSEAPAAGRLVTALAREGLVWRDLGLLDEPLLAALATFSSAPIPHDAHGFELDALVWCLPVGSAAPRVALYRFGRLLRAVTPGFVAVVLIPDDSSSGDPQDRAEGPSTTTAWLRTLCRAACGRKTPILQMATANSRNRHQRTAICARRLRTLFAASGHHG